MVSRCHWREASTLTVNTVLRTACCGEKLILRRTLRKFVLPSSPGMIAASPSRPDRTVRQSVSALQLSTTFLKPTEANHRSSSCHDKSNLPLVSLGK